MNALVPNQQNFKATNKMMDLLNDSSNSQHQWVSILSPLDVNISFLVHAIKIDNICKDANFEISDDIVLAAYIAGCANVVAYVETYMTKVPMHINIHTRYEWVQYALNGNEKKCRNAFRMSSHVFRQLCNILRTQHG